MAQLVEALRYKLEGRGVRFLRALLEFFFMALGLAQPLTEMSTRNISWG